LKIVSYKKHYRRYSALKIKKTTVANILIISLLVLVLVLSISFAGCKAKTGSETAAGTTLAGETTAATTAAGETTAATAEEGPNPNEITGNINILTGQEISATVLNSRPFAVMVENTPDARPQSGIINADVVFEVVDEGGVTRLVSVFSSKEPDLIGPVRSTRPYYAEIARSFNPVLVFWGTAPQFYTIVANLGLDYLSPLGDGTGNSSIAANFVDPGKGEGKDAIRDPTRVGPHDAYIRLPRMKEIAKELGYSLEGGQSPFKFKQDAVVGDKGDVKDININFSAEAYKVNYAYDSASNTYLRSCGGSPSVDRESGKQMAFNNVIVLITDIKNSGDAAGHMQIRTTQSGNAFYFIDGKVIEGTWGRDSALDPFSFKDKDGKTILVNRGQTYVSMISGIEQLEY
jgi:Protein of unknown function (DUF3048).